MKIRFIHLVAALIVALLLTLRAPALAQNNMTVTIDENCNGTFDIGNGPSSLACLMTLDLNPGGLSSVMDYVGLTWDNPGDIRLIELGTRNTVSDVIRFSGTGSKDDLFFYSDNEGGADAQADVGLPSALMTNVVTLREFKQADGTVGAIYTPSIDQPGFFAGFAMTYHIISDGESVPEPGSLALLLGSGLAGLLLIRRKR